jgi:Zn-dependent protease
VIPDGAPSVTCANCGARVGAAQLACPACHALIHARRLRELADEASAASGRQDVSAELSAWRSALELLPPASTQFETVRARIAALSQQLLAPPRPPTSRSWKGSGGALAGVALVLWKFKAAGLFLLTKGKLLALGLTKSSTLLSMAASLGVYWAAFGWKFAAGLIASIYVHEMGHVAALRYFGIAATAPMFIPGLGAVIRSHQLLSNPHEEARVGLAGPIWGLATAVAAYAAYAVTGAPIWAAIGHFGAWVNLFNLMPVWQLDGAHAFRPLTRVERAIAASSLVLMFVVTREGLLVLMAILAGVQAWNANENAPGDRPVLLQFIALVVVLSWMSTLQARP